MANLSIDSLEPEVDRPRLTSFSIGVLPRIAFINFGPEAPSLAKTSAPPIHNKNGPVRRTRLSIKKFSSNPSPPVSSSNLLSTIASKPIANIDQ